VEMWVRPRIDETSLGDKIQAAGSGGGGVGGDRLPWSSSDSGDDVRHLMLSCVICRRRCGQWRGTRRRARRVDEF